MTTDIHSLVKFHLAAGSHKQPNSDGSICINEAAIIAAGFEYREINSVHDCPPCFSHVIGAYALRLNDKMPDDLRNKLLMPFVVRLAGTADTREVELKRVHFIAIETVKRILSLVCEVRLNRKYLADKCRNVETLKHARDVSKEVRSAGAYSAAYAYSADAYSAAYSAYSAAADAREKIYVIATQILDEAIKLGKHQELEICEIVPRLEKAKLQKVAA